MEHGNDRGQRLGWVGTGRMGYALASRLLEAGCDVAVYNRTRAKAEPQTEGQNEAIVSPTCVSSAIWFITDCQEAW